jgi:hypothetical protein
MKVNATQTAPTTVTLTNVRIMYANNLVTPRPESVSTDGKTIPRRYEATILIPDTEVNALSILERASIEALKAKLKIPEADVAQQYAALKFQPKQLAVRPGALKPQNTELQGHHFIALKASLDRPPVLMHMYQGPDGKPMVLNRQIEAHKSVIYSGCYVNIQVNLWGYKHQSGTIGVSADVLAVQFAGDGEEFSSGAMADTSVFGATPAPADASVFAVAPSAPQQFAQAPQQFATPPVVGI